LIPLIFSNSSSFQTSLSTLFSPSLYSEACDRIVRALFKSFLSRIPSFEILDRPSQCPGKLPKVCSVGLPFPLKIPSLFLTWATDACCLCNFRIKGNAPCAFNTDIHPIFFNIYHQGRVWRGNSGRLADSDSEYLHKRIERNQYVSSLPRIYLTSANLSSKPPRNRSSPLPWPLSNLAF
jgi:hypothetical protein